MKIMLREIPGQGRRWVFEKKAEDFPFLVEIAHSSEIRFLENIRTVLDVAPAGDIYQVHGEFRAKIELDCARCLDRFLKKIESSFELAFTREMPRLGHDHSEDDLERKAEEMGLHFISAEEIDFREAVREQIVMAFPNQPICRTDCRGLCPHCGANQNRETCRCDAGSIDPRFAILQNLKLDP